MADHFFLAIVEKHIGVETISAILVLAIHAVGMPSTCGIHPWRIPTGIFVGIEIVAHASGYLGTFERFVMRSEVHVGHVVFPAVKLFVSNQIRVVIPRLVVPVLLVIGYYPVVAELGHVVFGTRPHKQLINIPLVAIAGTGNLGGHATVI